MSITITPKGYAGAVKEVHYGPPVNIFVFAAGAACAVVLLLALLLLGIGWWHGRMLSDLSGRRDALAAQKEVLRQSEEGRLLAAQKRVKEIRELLTAHYNGKYLFDALAARTRGDVRFVDALVDFNRGSVVLTGRAESFLALANQLLAFQFDDQNRFRSVSVSNIAASDDELSAYIGFRLTLGFDQFLILAK